MLSNYLDVLFLNEYFFYFMLRFLSKIWWFYFLKSLKLMNEINYCFLCFYDLTYFLLDFVCELGIYKMINLEIFRYLI